MFWTDHGFVDTSRVSRAGMDGSGHQVIIDSVGWANGMAADFSGWGRDIGHIFIFSKKRATYNTVFDNTWQSFYTQ